MPVGTSPEPGRWRSRTYQSEVLRSISDPSVEGTLYIGCSQGGGKTEIILDAAAYFMGHDPAPILIVEPNLDMAGSLSKDRLAPMIRETPALSERVKDPRTRDSGNTVRHKEFPGGHVTIVGANSAAGLAMRPIRVVLFDEIDRYPPSAGTEGDPLSLAQTRASAFWNRVFVYCTSPGRKGGRSWRLWEKSDRREFYVPCPDCEHAQVLRWSQVQWDKDVQGEAQPETAAYACERCGVLWDDATRWRAIDRGEYRATHAGSGKVRGFRLPAMAVQGWKLSALVSEWYECEGNPEKRKVFVNTRLCEWWEEEYDTVDETGLLARRKKYPEVEGRIAVPSEVALLTAGVDVQDNRFEATLYGWGSGEEVWTIAHAVIYGDPATPTSWDEVDAWLRQPWPRESGGVDYIRGACVDTGGHHTQAAYDFCGPRFRLPTPDGGRAFVFAIKGQHGAGEVWPRKPSKATTKVPLWPIRVDPAKEQVYGRLAIAEPGPGYVHFCDELEDAFFVGLTAEKVTTRVNRRGFPERFWELRHEGMRNEPLDCAVYAYAALCGLRANGFDLEAEVARLPTRPVFRPPEGSAPAPIGKREPVPERPRRRRGRGWINPSRDWIRR